jgi:hypothetical protein
MRKVSDRTQSNSGSSSSGKSAGSGDADKKYAHIRAANRKVRLLDVLRKLGYKIEPNPQRPIWSHNIICPLPSHKGGKENTPSFGYNFVKGHFHCFGCKSTGGVVEFLSNLEGKPRTVVAEAILAQYGDDVSHEDFNDYEDDINPVLLEGSSFLQELVQKYKGEPKVMEQIHKLIWWIDFYLMEKSPTHSINAKDLKYRIDRIKELLNDETLKMLNSR